MKWSEEWSDYSLLIEFTMRNGNFSSSALRPYYSIICWLPEVLTDLSSFTSTQTHSFAHFNWFVGVAPATRWNILFIFPHLEITLLRRIQNSQAKRIKCAILLVLRLFIAFISFLYCDDGRSVRILNLSSFVSHKTEKLIKIFHRLGNLGLARKERERNRRITIETRRRLSEC